MLYFISMSRWIILFILNFLFVSNPEVSQAAPRCADFIFTEAQDQISFNLMINQKRATNLLEVSLSNLKILGELNETEKIILNISEQGFKEMSSAQITTLKTSRKYLAVLRSLIQVVSESHEAPAQYDNFVKDFGRLNDYIAFQKEAESVRMAQAVRQHLEKFKIKKLKKEIQMASTKSIKKYFENLKLNTLQMLAKEKVSIEEFHQIRKNLKEYLSYFQLSYQLSENKTDQLEYQFLYELNEDLGLLNDELTLQVVNHQAEKEKTKILFPDKLAQKIKFFLKSYFFT